jgi:hypothetical protein
MPALLRLADGDKPALNRGIVTANQSTTLPAPRDWLLMRAVALPEVWTFATTTCPSFVPTLVDKKSFRQWFRQGFRQRRPGYAAHGLTMDHKVGIAPGKLFIHFKSVRLTDQP